MNQKQILELMKNKFVSSVIFPIIIVLNFQMISKKHDFHYIELNALKLELY